MLFILFLIFLKLWIQKETFQLGGHEHNTNSVEASETMSTNSASSPIPSYMHNHSNDTTTNDINEKRRHKSSSEDSKVSTYILEALLEISLRGVRMLGIKHRGSKC